MYLYDASLLRLASLSLLTAFALTSCHDTPEFTDDTMGNFDALAEIVDTRYCYLAEKNIDWSEITARYRARLKPGASSLDLFLVCSEMLDELKDGHVNLSTPFSTSYYRAWWSDYPQNFSLRTLQQYYLDFDYMQTSGISYKVLDDHVGYIYYPSFSTTVGQLNLDYILAYLQKCDVLVIDVRDNGGGALTNVETFVSRLIDKEITAGYIIHKTGPGHNDFSEPFPFSYSPAPQGRLRWSPTKPVYLLVNRSSYSATNNFAAVMKSLPNVTVVGATTGGGGGLPFSQELPNGWVIRFSSCPILAPDGSHTEEGIPPTEGWEIDCTEEDLAAGHDAILDAVLNAEKR